MTRAPSNSLPLTISEADFQRTVIDCAIRSGWRVTHSRPAQVRNGRWVTPIQGHPGSPDLLLARGGEVLLAELKTMRGVVTPGQRMWLEHLGDFGRLWRPNDWKAIFEELR